MKSATFDETMANGSPDVVGSHLGSVASNRARSNTWSIGSQPMIMTEIQEDERTVLLTALNCSSSVEADSSGASPPVTGNKEPATNFRKNWTRRNAWGNLSYAELITKAIESSAEKRLTLSQIYDWIVHNVDYFANKGDNSSSAGWKNSIRHNLSLHSRFVRLVNDGAGKSSWWSINPDAQPLKPSRRRAATLDSSSKTMRKRNGETAAGAGAHHHRGQGFAGRSLEEVDSTTSGLGAFMSSSMLSPGNSSQEEVMDIGINGSPTRYPRERGFSTAPGDMRIGGDAGGRSGSGSPLYGIRDGFRMDLLGGGKRHDPDLCFQSPENRHGNGQLNGGAKLSQHGKPRRYIPSSLDDRSISLGFCAGNGIFYDDVFDPPPHSGLPGGGGLPGAGPNGYYPKRYLSESGGYATGLAFGNCHGNGYYQDDAYSGGFCGNGGCFDNRSFPDGRYAREIVPLSVPGMGSREVSGRGQGLCTTGGFPEVKDPDQNRSRSKAGSNTGDENRELDAIPVGRYCSPYVDMESGKETGGYNDANQGPFRHDNDCFRDDGLHPNPSVSRFQDEERKTESSLTDASFFRALITTSGYADDFLSNSDGVTLRPISSPGVFSSHETNYRSTAGNNKYPYLPDAAAKPFSQLLANRAAYPTCRNASTVDGFYIPTTF